MKEKITLILALSLVFISVCAAYKQNCSQGINATELAYIYLVGQPRSLGGEFQNKYGKPITDTFGIIYNWPNPSIAHWARVCVGMRINVSSAPEDFNITFEKDGNMLESVPDTLTAAYEIAIEPPEGENQPGPGEGEKKDIDKGEWIGEGGNFDSPPVTYVSEEFIRQLCNEGQSMYIHSNYGVNKPCDVEPKPVVVATRGANVSKITPFKTEEETFTSIPSTYKAGNGFDAYVIPLGGLREEAYGAVQVFKTGKSVSCFIACGSKIGSNIVSIHDIAKVGVNKRVVNGKIVYEISGREAVRVATEYCKCYMPGAYSKYKKPKLICLQGSNYYVYVDKIFYPKRGKAYKAAWLISAYPDNTSSNIIFSIPVACGADLNAGELPEVDFDYEIELVSGEEIILSFTAEASDPDGTIKSYEWDFGDGYFAYEPNVKHSFAPGTYAVTLTVRDDSGLEAKETKVIIIGSETNVIKIDAYSGTGKGKIKVHCSVGKTSTIDIIRINEKLEPEATVKEAMKVNCNEEIEVELEKGYYMVKPTFAEQPRAYFSVN